MKILGTDHQYHLVNMELHNARHARRAPTDKLAERMRSVALWRSCPWHQQAGDLPPCWALYKNSVFRRLLMPGLQAHLSRTRPTHHERRRMELEAVRRTEIESRPQRGLFDAPGVVVWLAAGVQTGEVGQQ